MPLISTVIVLWCKKHQDGDDDGDDRYDYAPAACMEGDGDDDDDGDYDYAPAAPLEGDDDDDNGDYDYAPAVQVGKSNCCAFQDTFVINCFGEDWSSKACLSK